MKSRQVKQFVPEGRLKFRMKSSAVGILEELRTLCLSLPETHERNSFGHPNFVAGKKTFVTFEQFNGRPSIAFRLDRDNIVRLSKNPLFFDTPYGRGEWLSLRVDSAFDWGIVRELVQVSYRIVALKRMLAALDQKGVQPHDRLR
jgi:predicted DNA-binding protein (MmcQ/YjbR family)